jgi:DNA-binding transcriptional MocR family regulator
MVKFSESAKTMRSSAIRKLMALAADPSIISFAGGMPANSLFPTDVVDELYNSLSVQSKQMAMQYGPTAGYPPLLESLKTYLKNKGYSLDGQTLIITTGAQQAINLLAKVLIDPNDIVVTEYPSFIGALAAFKSYGADFKSVELDNDGINLTKLEKILDQHAAKIKMLYLCPYFHNPAGIIYSRERIQKLMKLLEGRDLMLLEDDPYGELYFDESYKPLTESMKITYAGNEPVPICNVGTFAKILGPGFRLGWVLGPSEIIDKCELAKQSMDACSSTFTQVIAHEYLSKGKLAPYVSEMRTVYARRASLMLDALKKYMPSNVTWTTPKGGFYVWVTMPEHLDAADLFEKTIKKGAAFVVGNAFDPDGVKNNSFRLAFSHTPEQRIEEGVKIIADAVSAMLSK